VKCIALLLAWSDWSCAKRCLRSRLLSRCLYWPLPDDEQLFVPNMSRII